MIKLIATDLDGTLLNSQGNLSKNTLDVLERLKERMIPIVIASGRTSSEIMKMAKQIKLDEYSEGYIISYNGVVTAKTKPFQIIEEKFLDPDTSQSIIRFLLEHKVKIHIFTPNNIFVSHDIEATLKNQSEREKISVKVNLNDTLIDEPIYKILVYDEIDKLNTIKTIVPEPILKNAHVFKSHNQLLEFVSIEGSKGDALKRLLKHLNINEDEAMAFGDEENDISMLKSVGFGIAMGNAKTIVKENARMITLSNDFDGVAEIINHYILNQGR